MTSKCLHKNFLCSLLTMSLLVLSSSFAHDAHALTGRLAYSADGNQHDRDDIGATPLGLALLDHKGWNSKLVYYGYSDHVWDQNNNQARDMQESTLQAASRFGFNRGVFYNVYANKERAYNALASEINKSTSGNPLTIVAAGPMMAVCQSILRSDSSKRQFVTVVSHSNWNNQHRHGDSSACDASGIKRTGVRFDQIIDQNQGVKNNSGLNNPYSLWEWMKNHSNADLRWVHSRMVKAFADKADPSDAGMVWYLISGKRDENANPQKLKDFFANKSGATPSGGGVAANASSSSAASTQRGVGTITLEAENGQRVTQGSWRLERNIRGYSGSGYYRWAGGDLFSSPGQGTLRYNFTVDQPGVYDVTLRASRPETGEPSDRNNDFFIRMNGGDWKKIFFGGARNTWNTAKTFDVKHAKSPSRYSLSSGTNVLEVSGRSREAIFDSITISGAGSVLTGASSSGGSFAPATSASASSGGTTKAQTESSNRGGSYTTKGTCTVEAESLSEGRSAFEKKCRVRYNKKIGHDCDLINNGTAWLCSNANIAWE